MAYSRVSAFVSECEGEFEGECQGEGPARASISQYELFSISIFLFSFVSLYRRTRRIVVNVGLPDVLGSIQVPMVLDRF